MGKVRIGLTLNTGWVAGSLSKWSKPERAGWEQAFSSVIFGRWWEVK